jgi:hypothetical protein
VSIIIDLGSSQCFVKHCNNACLLLVLLFTWFTTDSLLPLYTYFVILGVAGLYGLIINRPNNEPVTHLELHEGEPGVCKGMQETDSEFQCIAVLCELRCRYTVFGCWLAFKKIPNKKCSNRFLQEKLQWAFIPRFLVSSSQYKSVCRHLIWHSSEVHNRD